jgi:hypothetical protein
MNMPNAARMVLAVFWLAGALHAADLVPNGGFEQPAAIPFLAPLDAKVKNYYAGAADAPFAAWAFGGKWDRGDYAVALSNDAHTGQHSCQIICNRKGRGGIACSPITLNPGDIIQVSLWVKAKDALGGRIFLNFEGAPGDGWASKDLKTGTYDWTCFTKRAVVPGRKAGGPQTLAIFLYTTCEGSVWVDDFSVQTVDVNAMAEAPDQPAAGPKMPRPIAEPPDSIGYRINTVSPLEKVFREDDFSTTTSSNIEIASARNEYESMQIVIEAPWRPVTIKQVTLSDLKGPNGAVIPASALKWNRVEYVETTVAPPYFTDRGLGAYPDPLMPAGEFTADKLSRTPVWITLKTPTDCPAGSYAGTITIIPDGLKPTTIPVSLTVWNFTLTDQTHLRTLTWLGTGLIRAWYGLQWSAEGNRRYFEAVRNYEDCLLEHRLGPGGEVAAHVNKGKDGKFDFTGVDATLQRLFDKGMNAFIMGTAPNLRREKKTEYTPEFIDQFTSMIRAYGDHLREKGWLDKAYVYVYDEAPKSAWPEVKKIDLAIKAAAPGLRTLQCLNQPEGVKELTGFADVFDVYVTQYHKAGVAPSQAKGAEVWLAICCYPMDHPNFFIEYPLLDVRVTPWICWKYKANGFEYWSPNAWGVNWQKKGDKWPAIPWVANGFGRYNGDGYLIYPGPDLKPLSCIRFEALRDGLEDYEYLWTLNSLVKEAQAAGRTSPALAQAQQLLSLDPIIKETGSYSPAIETYAAYRQKLAQAIIALKTTGGKP